MMRRLLNLSLATLILSSCAIHTGNTSSNAAVTDDNFRIMDLAIGQAQTKQVFGIGGLNPDALVLEAKTAMYRNYPLEAGQIYANVTVDYKRSFYLIVVTTMVTVSADVVQFNPSESQKKEDIFSKQQAGRPSAEPMAKPSGRSTSEYLKPGEQVGVYTMGDLKVMKLENQVGKKRYELLSTDSSKFIYDVKSIYLIDELTYDFEHGYSVGEQVKWEVRGESKTGMIIGVNENMLVIKNEDKITEFPPEDVNPIETE
ncbi:hypothetical protein O3Q51_01950 [Cryomorphaceae bacterium 1068]|nr:hypothetical protein [Cryomorphaceae bacterium 1068]